MDNTYEVDNIIQVNKITSTTLVGVMGQEYPFSNGNCFSVCTADDQKHFRVVNFGYENLKELLRREVISWPLDIIPISERHCVIADHRIPNEWYNDSFCSVCTPHSLLPPQQKLQRVLDIRSGKRQEKEYEIDGKKGVIVSYNVQAKAKKIDVKWTVEPIVEFYAHPDAEESLKNELIKSKYGDKPINSDFYTTIRPSDFINDSDDTDDESDDE